MNANFVAWDIETVPDIKGFAVANGHDGKSDDDIRAAPSGYIDCGANCSTCQTSCERSSRIVGSRACGSTIDSSRNTRWAAGDIGRIRSLAAEMVGLAPDVIFTSGFSTIRPLLDVTRTLPIVFANVVDPRRRRLRRDSGTSRRRGRARTPDGGN
jgi:hypothetical protein